MSDDLRTEIVAKAESLGITVDGRWGVERIENEIADAIQRDQEARTKQARREPPKPEPENSDERIVECRVTKKGDRKIYTGQESPARYDWDDNIKLPFDIAKKLEDRGFVEIGSPPK